MDLTTVSRVLDLIEYSGDSLVSASTFIGKIITLYSELAEKRMNRTALAASTFQYFDVEAGEAQVFGLTAYPVSAISAVWSDSSREYGSGSLLSSDTYTHDPRTGILTIDRAGLALGTRSLKVEYTGGMAANTTAFIAAFPMISEALDQQVAYHYGRREELGSTTLTLPGGQRSFTGTANWLPLVRDVLDAEKKWL